VYTWYTKHVTFCVHLIHKARHILCTLDTQSTSHSVYTWYTKHVIFCVHLIHKARHILCTLDTQSTSHSVYTWYTKHVTFCVPLPVSVTVSICTVSAFIFLPLTPNIAVPSLPVHNIPPPVPSIALDMQHFLKPFSVTSGELHCHADMIHVD